MSLEAVHRNRHTLFYQCLGRGKVSKDELLELGFGFTSYGMSK